MAHIAHRYGAIANGDILGADGDAAGSCRDIGVADGDGAAAGGDLLQTDGDSPGAGDDF